MGNQLNGKKFLWKNSHQVNDREVQFMSITNWSDSLAEHLQNYENVLLVLSKGGSNRGYYSKIQDNFESKSVSVIEDVPTLPDLDYVEKLFNDFKGIKFDCIVGIGGGSVIDITKALKVIINMSSHAKFNKDFFDGEIDLDLSTPDLIAIPTTAGTGSEVTSFSTLWDKSVLRKKSIHHSKLKPDFVIYDENLLKSLSYQNLLFPAFDAISHAFDSLWNINLTKESKELALNSIKLSTQAFENLAQPPKQNSYDSETYKNLLQASSLAGMAINLTRTSLSHSISYPLTSHFNIPHGLACIFTVPTIFSIVKSSLDLSNGEIVELDFLLKILKNFDLSSVIKPYFNELDVFSLLPEMKSNRSENFFMNVDQLLITKILDKSLNT
jgi:alcohol dehydrogenase